VTAFVPSDTACFANSPGRRRRTDVWISREVSVWRLLYRASLIASAESLSKESFTKEFMILIARREIPVSGCTCFNTL